MRMFFFRTFFLLTIVSYQNILSQNPLSEDYNGVCASSDACGERCLKIHKMFRAENSESVWADRYESIAGKLIEYNVKISIEIGVGRGGLSHYLLGAIEGLVHHGVDPFAGGFDGVNTIKPPPEKEKEKEKWNVRRTLRTAKKSRASTEWARAILYYLDAFGCRFRLHKGYSSQMVVHFLDDTIDCILFDGDHSHIGIVNDVADYAPKVKEGGLLIFDDYRNEDFLGVKAAVNEIAKLNNISVIAINDGGNVMLIKPYGVFKVPKTPKHQMRRGSNQEWRNEKVERIRDGGNIGGNKESNSKEGDNKERNYNKEGRSTEGRNNIGENNKEGNNVCGNNNIGGKDYYGRQ